MKSFRLFVVLITAVFGAATVCAAAAEKPHPYRLPALPDKMPPVIWGSEAGAPDGSMLAFGGEDQNAEDGQYHTHFKSAAGSWTELTAKLRANNPLQGLHDRVWALRQSCKDALAKVRFIYLEGAGADAQVLSLTETMSALRVLSESLSKIQPEFERQKNDVSNPYHKSQLQVAALQVSAARGDLQGVLNSLSRGVDTDSVQLLHGMQIQLEQAAEALDAEPSPRTFSPLIYDAKTSVFVLFGGDHLDYLTNDTWIFDPAKQTWQQRRPKFAPPPRAHHQLTASEGNVALKGGYVYSDNTDYMGGPYIDLDDGVWTYDISADRWTSETGRLGDSESTRIYHGGPFHPEFFLQGQRPDAASFAARLDAIQVNTWVEVKPPYLPKMQRDWGTAVIDPDHDVLLRWSGGHCAHGGSDVVMYHLNSNRWELPFPVEFPLGQCYTNTSYPRGVNLNQRPWITGHTYKSYGYDSIGKRMLFVGQQADFFLFDPEAEDWRGRGRKPDGMNYGGGYYDLLCKQIPQGIVCWTREGRLFFYEGKPDGTAGEWKERKVSGAKLPGSNVDSAGIDYDSKRSRLLLFPGNYGKPYSGQIVSVDLTTNAALLLNPTGMSEAARMPAFLRETCYSTTQDAVLVGVTFPPGEDGARWTPVYDCATNKWLACNILGPNPSGKEGRNVSLGLVYDTKRDLNWAVNTQGDIFVLRLNIKKFEEKSIQDLK